MLTFIESPSFTRQLVELWSDAEYAAFQQFLATNPETGDVIPGLSGLRKVRWTAKGRGKRGGARVIYLLLTPPGIIFLFHCYTKGGSTDLSPEQKKRLRAAVEEIKAQLKP